MIIGVAAFDDDIAWLKQRRQRMQHRINRCGGKHQPHGAWLCQHLYELGELRCSLGAFGDQLLHRVRIRVIDHALVARLDQALHHVRAHATKADHAQFHRQSPLLQSNPATDNSAGRREVTASMIKPECSATTFIGAETIR